MQPLNTMPTWPSSESIGCLPASLKSRIASLRCPRVAPGQVEIPSESGPRRTSESTIFRTVRPSLEERSENTCPAIPHMNSLFQKFQDAKKEIGPRGAGRRLKQTSSHECCQSRIQFEAGRRPVIDRYPGHVVRVERTDDVDAPIIRKRYTIPRLLRGRPGNVRESIWSSNRVGNRLNLRVEPDRKSTRLNSSHLG